MNVETMMHDLHEGLEDLKSLHTRIRFRLGKRMTKEDWRELGREERKRPLDRWALEVTLGHTMRHLNWMWNERDMEDREVRPDSATDCFPREVMRLGNGNFHDSARSYYDRYLAWKSRQRQCEKPCASLCQGVARLFLSDPRYHRDDVARLWPGGVVYPDLNERVRYCRNRGEGWEDVSESVGEALRMNAYGRELSLWDGLSANIRNAIKRGNPAEFIMQLSISGHGYKLTRQWLRLIVAERGWRLLENLILHSDELFELVSPRRLLLKICADGRYDDAAAVQLVRALESRFPGLAKSVVDVFGDTPLWYTLYRYQRCASVIGGWKEDPSRLCSELVYRFGCDPNHKNSAGLSWRAVKCAMK